jgi:hypothetical protein
MIAETIHIGKPPQVTYHDDHGGYKLTPGFLKPGKNEDPLVSVRPGTPTCWGVQGADHEPLIYVTNPRKIICGSCRTKDAVLKVDEDGVSNVGMFMEMKLVCPKCHGVYTATQVPRNVVTERVHNNE